MHDRRMTIDRGRVVMVAVEDVRVRPPEDRGGDRCSHSGGGGGGGDGGSGGGGGRRQSAPP